MTLIQRLNLALAEIASAIRLRGQPRGGTVGQVLVKNSALDFDASWQTLPGAEPISSDTTLGITVRPPSWVPEWSTVATDTNIQVTLRGLGSPEDYWGESVLVRVYASADHAQDGWNLPAGQDANCLGWMQVQPMQAPSVELQFGLAGGHALYMTAQSSRETEWPAYLNINTLTPGSIGGADPGDLAALFTGTYTGTYTGGEPEVA